VTGNDEYGSEHVEQEPEHIEEPRLASPADRKRSMADAVAVDVARGWRVQSQTETDALLARGGNVNHLLHLVLTLLTCGIWGIVWIAIAIQQQEKHERITVDDYGQVLRQNL